MNQIYERRVISSSQGSGWQCFFLFSHPRIQAHAKAANTVRPIFSIAKQRLMMLTMHRNGTIAPLITSSMWYHQYSTLLPESEYYHILGLNDL